MSCILLDNKLFYIYGVYNDKVGIHIFKVIDENCSFEVKIEYLSSYIEGLIILDEQCCHFCYDNKTMKLYALSDATTFSAVCYDIKSNSWSRIDFKDELMKTNFKNCCCKNLIDPSESTIKLLKELEADI